MTKIKICGIYRNEDTEYVNEYMPDYFGMILCFPKSHRNISFEKAKEIRSLITSDVPAVGVFVNQTVETIMEYVDADVIQIIQLHGQESDEMIETLREKTDCEIWKAFKVRCKEDLDRALQSKADFVILDNGYGTGETFDWSLIGQFDRPFALAGGLNPDNMADAVKTLSPSLLDLSSGVETEKIKDKNKIMQAVKLAHSSDIKE